MDIRIKLQYKGELLYQFISSQVPNVNEHLTLIDYSKKEVEYVITKRSFVKNMGDNNMICFVSVEKIKKAKLNDLICEPYISRLYDLGLIETRTTPMTWEEACKNCINILTVDYYIKPMDGEYVLIRKVPYEPFTEVFAGSIKEILSYILELIERKEGIK